MVKMGNFTRQKVDQWFPEHRGSRELGVTAYRQRVSFWGDLNVLELDSGDGYTTLLILKTREEYILKS